MTTVGDLQETLRSVQELRSNVSLVFNSLKAGITNESSHRENESKFLFDLKNKVDQVSDNIGFVTLFLLRL